VNAEELESALAAYEDAAIRGLCADGAWEVAVGAMRSVDLSAIARPRSADHPDTGGA
jgi:hypothetical protein